MCGIVSVHHSVDKRQCPHHNVHDSFVGCVCMSKFYKSIGKTCRITSRLSVYRLGQV